MRRLHALFVLTALLIASSGRAQAPAAPSDPRDRIRYIREQGKRGEDGIAAVVAYMRDVELEVRLETVKQLIKIAGPKTVEPLVQMARDNDPEIQIRATDGLVNVYLPGYIKTGISASLSRAGKMLRVKFSDRNDQVIDGYVNVPPEVIEVIARLAGGGTSLESRANACRALGVLRARPARPELEQALASKDGQVMYEALVALQKIGDPAAGPAVVFLLRDLEERVRIAALETVGILRTTEAAPRVRELLNDAPNARLQRAAMSSLAMIALPEDRGVFLRNLTAKDASLRAASAEGLARIRNPADQTILAQAFTDERDAGPRLSLAFALVALGRADMNELSPLRYLVNTLNRAAYRGVALAFLTELAREPAVRNAVYPYLPTATREEKTGLSIVFSRSGGRDSVPYLETMQKDADLAVVQEAVRSLRTLEARLR
jgi:HEAT repeat protein